MGKSYSNKNQKFNKSHQRRDGGFGDMLHSAAADHLMVVKSNGRRALYKSAESWKGDGVDHININFNAQTEIGQMLDFSYRMVFNHAIFGKFTTMSGFWAYIRSEERHDHLRTLVGAKLQELSRELTNRKVKHLRAILMDTAYQRVKGNSKLAKEVFANELPFDMYWVNDSGVPIRPSHHDWVVDGYTEISKAIHGGTEPDFSFLCDGPTTDIYESVRPTTIPQYVLDRIEARKGYRKPREMSVSTDTPKESTYQRVEHKNWKKDEYRFDPTNAYTRLIPVVSEITSGLILDAFRRTVKINDHAILTGPLVSDVGLPLIQISDHGELAKEGLTTSADIVRAGPVFDHTFTDTFSTNNVIKLDHFVIKETQDSYTVIPLWLKLINKSFDREGDNQQVTVLEDKTQHIKRDVFLYKPIDQVLTDKEEMPAFIKTALELVSQEPDAAKYDYVVLRVVFELKLRTDTQPEIYLTGHVAAVGVSTGSHDDNSKKTSFIEDMDHAERFGIQGYTFELYRGKLRGEKTVESAVGDQNLVTPVDFPISDADPGDVHVNVNPCVYGPQETMSSAQSEVSET